MGDFVNTRDDVGICNQFPESFLINVHMKWFSRNNTASPRNEPNEPRFDKEKECNPRIPCWLQVQYGGMDFCCFNNEQKVRK